MNCRIALAGLHMECATVRPQVTTREVFEAITARGRDVIETFRGSNTVMGGFLGTIEQSGIEAVPIFHADGGAAGFADQAAIITYRQELVDHLKTLHGKAFQQRSS